MGRFAVALNMLAFVYGCTPDPYPADTGASADNTASKIELDLHALDSRGLQGPPDGLRSMAYEFCIPEQEEHVLEVSDIDASVNIYRQSPGRIQCRPDQYLCIGETHQADFRKVLQRLATLPYIQRIVPAYFE